MKRNSIKVDRQN